jgi:hypothetical protein
MATTSKTSKKAAKSGNPAKRGAAAKAAAYAEIEARQAQITSPDAWVSREGRGEDATILTLPSGNTCKVRRVGPEAFLTQGLIPDRITPIVEKAIKSKKGMRPEQQAKMVKDPKQLGAAMEMMDRLLCYAVVEPTVLMPPECLVCNEINDSAADQHEDESRDDFHAYQPKPRQAGALYADRVDLDDKMFVMQFSMGGTRDLERFRSEHGAGLAGILSFKGSGG